MLFGKEKMYLGSFCRGMFSKIITIPIQSYEDYLENDEYKGLTSDEYAEFCKRLPSFRNALICAAVNQKVAEGKIKCSDTALGTTLLTALQYAYEDNNYSDEEITEGLDSTLIRLEDLSRHVETVLITMSDSEFLREGYMFHACKSFAATFDDFVEDRLDPHKHGPLVCITNNNKNLIQDYFEGCFKKVSIIE